MSDQPLMLYVHIPFCAHKCHYCDFNSHVRDTIPWHDYTRALLQELQYWSLQPQFAKRTFSSIFIGGGTPSLMPAEYIYQLISEARKHFLFTTNIEITMEANPGSAEANRFKAYRTSGINRLSIGVQSMDQQELQWLERIHSREEALQAFSMARAAGFENINLDLMYGLPNQSFEQWQYSLHQLLQLNPEHLSCYQLTVEPHTKLAAAHASSPYNLPDESTGLYFFQETRKTLKNHGYQAYEISNFAKQGLECQHNDGYWRYFDYIGIGAGASGKWDTMDGGVYRYSNIRRPEHYIRSVSDHHSAILSDETLDLSHSAAEAVWLGLRRQQGIDGDRFQRRFGVSLKSFAMPKLQSWHRSGDIAFDNGNLRLTDQGLVMADTIAAAML